MARWIVRDQGADKEPQIAVVEVDDVYETAKDDGLFVVGENGGVDDPFRGHHISKSGGTDGGLNDVGDFLVDFQAHGVSIVHMGCDGQLQADILTVNRSERII